LALSLSGAFAFHYFSILLFGPFAVAEAIRTIRRRTLDVAVWLALGVPFLLLILYLPVVRQTRANSGVPTYWFATPAWYRSLDDFANQFFGPTILALLLVACIYIATQNFSKFQGSRIKPEEDPGAPQFSYEIPLALALAGLPLLGIAMGKFATHYFYPRYVIAAMFGMAVLTVMVLWRAFSGRKDAGLLVVLVFCAVFGHTAFIDLRAAATDRAVPTAQRIQNRIPVIARKDQLPIAVGHAFAFMEFNYYGDASLLKRMCYLSSPEYALQYDGGNAGEYAMIKSAPYFGTQVVDYRAWTRKHRLFYLVDGAPFAIAQLIRDGAHLQLLQSAQLEIPGHTADLFFLVSFPDN
jgi:hypothetical protein